MFSTELRPSAYMARRLFFVLIPVCALIMIVTTATTGLQSILLVKSLLHGETMPATLKYFQINIVTTIVTEFFALCFAGFIIYRLQRHIGRLADGLQQLTRSVLHDLKTPLAHIAITAEALRDGSVPPAQAAADITASTQSLTDMINLNAEISQTYAGLGTTGQHEVDLIAVTRDIVDLYSAVAEDKGIRLITNLPSSQLFVKARPHDLNRLISNLLDNAVKFTPEGGTITITLKSTGHRIEFSVADTGCGIAKDDLPHIFERFYQANTPSRQAGHGLGLALVHAIVTSLHAQIRVNSKPNQGTTFTIAVNQLR